LTPAEALRSSNPVPQDFTSLDKLWEWHKPLIEAEIKKGNEEKTRANKKI